MSHSLCGALEGLSDLPDRAALCRRLTAPDHRAPLGALNLEVDLLVDLLLVEDCLSSFTSCACVHSIRQLRSDRSYSEVGCVPGTTRMIVNGSPLARSMPEPTLCSTHWPRFKCPSQPT